MHCRTLILQRPTKLFNTSYASLFDLLPSDILEDIYILQSGLKHCDRLKHVILRFKSMSNPVLFKTPHELFTLYHNFGYYRWYNQVK